MTDTNAIYAALMAGARVPAAPATLALAGVIAAASTRSGPYRAPIFGLAPAELDALMHAYFPGAAHLLPLLQRRRAESEASARERLDEFEDLLDLLLAHRSLPGDAARWVACAIATASMGGNHLWQDLGLPNRGVLNALMTEHFGPLKAKNAGDMKWKKFFYRQLCRQAEVPICKSPSCGACVDQPICFGKEEGAALFPRDPVVLATGA